MRLLLPILISFTMLPCGNCADDTIDIVQRILANDIQDKEVAFAEVVRATSGHRVIPINPNDPVDARLIERIGIALDRVLVKVNTRSSSTKASRINEMSRVFEDAIATELAAVAGFSCAVPLTTGGASQRSGYPDLRLEDEESGRILYLDPKIYASGSEDSTLRTFYFKPRTKTGKITEDAHHLLIGISHDGNTGNWKFLRWSIIDLSRLKVRLKAELQAANRDIYREAATIAAGGSDAK